MLCFYCFLPCRFLLGFIKQDGNRIFCKPKLPMSFVSNSCSHFGSKWDEGQCKKSKTVTVLGKGDNFHLNVCIMCKTLFFHSSEAISNIFLYLFHYFSCFFVIKFVHFIVTAFFLWLQTLKLNIKNWKTKNYKF